MTQAPISDRVASRVRTLRKARRWSVRELAEECQRLGYHLTTASIGNIERTENGKRKRRDVTVDNAAALAGALGVALSALLGPTHRITSDGGWEGIDRVTRRCACGWYTASPSEYRADIDAAIHMGGQTFTDPA